MSFKMLNSSQLQPTKCNCWQLCVEKGFFCYSSCWVSRIASLTLRPCYTFKGLWGIWILDAVVFLKFLFWTWQASIFAMSFCVYGCYWKWICIFVHLSCRDVQKWLLCVDLVIRAFYIYEEQISNHSLEELWLLMLYRPRRQCQFQWVLGGGRGGAPLQKN